MNKTLQRQTTNPVDCAESSRADDLSSTQLRLFTKSETRHIWAGVTWCQLLHDTESLELRRLRQDLIFTYKLVFGLVDLNVHDFFIIMFFWESSSRTRL